MIKIKIQYEECCDQINALIEAFDFNSPGPAGQTLGKDVVVSVAMGIAKRSAQGLDANGQPFKPNESGYSVYKEKRYGVDRPGELGGQTLSLESLIGEVTTTPDKIEMVHGIDQTPASSARNGVGLRESERRLTDRQKGILLTDQGRPFYVPEVNAEAEVARIAEEALKNHLRGAGP